jgi:hypothetical protein
VRLFTRNGHDWTDHYPLIVEASCRVRSPRHTSLRQFDLTWLVSVLGPQIAALYRKLAKLLVKYMRR